MGITASAAEVVAKSLSGDASEATAETSGAAFRGRRVASANPERQGRLTEERQTASAIAGTAGERRSSDLRALSTPGLFSGTGEPDSELTGRGVQGEPSTEPLSVPPAAGRSGTATDVPAKLPKGDFADRPWLTEEQNAERCALARRLKGLSSSQRPTRGSRNNPYAAVSYLSEVEMDIMKADRLLKDARTRLLSNAQWHDLKNTVGWYRHSMPNFQAELDSMLDELRPSGSLEPEQESLLQESLQRLIDTHGYLSTDASPCADLSREITINLPAWLGNIKAVVTSRLVPGTAFGATLPAGYPDDGGAGPARIDSHRHVPDLALSTLVNSANLTTFSALQHGVIHARDRAGNPVAHPSHDTTESPDGNLPGSTDQSEPVRSHFENPDQYPPPVAANKSSGAEETRRQTCLRLARETATAALASHPEKLQSALAGTTVNLTLTSISLLTSDELERWGDQRRAFADLEQSTPALLTVLTPEGALGAVHANIKVRQFVVSAETERFGREAQHQSSSHSLSSTAERLLGSADSPNLGGDVAMRLVELKDRIAQSRLVLNESERNNARRQAAGGPDAIKALLERDKIAARKDELNLEERSVRTLQAAGERLKSILATSGGWPADKNARMDAAALVALVAHLMDESPLLNCISSRDLAGLLDSEIKALATFADMMDGRLPEPHQDILPAIRQAAHRALSLP